MHKFEVTIKNKHDGNTWTMQWDAHTFGGAEKKTWYQLEEVNGSGWTDHYEIIRIEKDYDNG